MIIETEFDIGQKVFKICPKCNDNHNGNCMHCAWRGCFSNGCDIGVKIYPDGSYCEHELQIIEYTVSERTFFNVKKYWKTMFYPTLEDAQSGLKEYDTIRKIPDKDKRVKYFERWKTYQQTGALNRLAGFDIKTLIIDEECFPVSNEENKL